MTRDVFRPQAADELLEVRDWHDRRRPGLGQEFGEELDAVVGRIAERPLAFPTVHGETRRAVLQRFPYAIYFRLTGEVVVMLAVHGRQHPSRWRRRS